MTHSDASLPLPGHSRPSLARRVRKRLGRWKCIVVDQWPYLPLVRAARLIRERHRPLLRHLPPVEAGEGPAAEVHMLCGHRDADMGVWAAWSLLRFLPAAELYLHSDGSLDAADFALWRRLSPRVTFTTKEERETRVSARVDEFPLLREWRRRQCYGAKFLDAHCVGRSDRLIMLDSDVLCFRRPDELIDALTFPLALQRWNRDCTTSYSAAPTALRATLGVDVPERVNTGFMLTKRWTDDDLAWFDRTLARLQEAGIAIHDRWAEQMLYAIGATRHEFAAGLSAKYDVTLGRIAPAAVIRHYVGVPRVRPRFHTEGVPLLLRQLGKPLGPAPASAPETRAAVVSQAAVLPIVSPLPPGRA